MVKKVHSAWWIVYFIDSSTNEPKFLLVKRHALSKKVERVAPKWKIQNGELPEQAAVREIGEEVWLDKKDLQVKEVLDTLSLQLYNEQWKLWVDKDITYFLVNYKWKPDSVHVADSEWFLWVYKWASIKEIISLVQYRDLRELFRMAYGMIGKISVRDEFINSL